MSLREVRVRTGSHVDLSLLGTDRIQMWQSALLSLRVFGLTCRCLTTEHTVPQGLFVKPKLLCQSPVKQPCHWLDEQGRHLQTSHFCFLQEMKRNSVQVIHNETLLMAAV